MANSQRARVHQRSTKEEVGTEGSVLPARRRTGLQNQTLKRPPPHYVGAGRGNPVRRFVVMAAHPLSPPLPTIGHLTLGACISLKSIDPTSGLLGSDG